MDDEQSLLNEPEPEESAAEAFARLDARIAGMDGRLAVMARAVEHLAMEKQTDGLPDYGATLTEMAGLLAGIRKTTEEISRSDLLSLTPEAYSVELDIAAEQARKADALTIREARTAFEKALVDIAYYRGTARSAVAQQSAVKWTAICTALGTAAVMILVAVSLVRGLPRSWGFSEYVATWAMNEPTSWEAGSRLMRADDEGSWEALMEAAKIWQDNRMVIAGCKKAAKVGRTTKCALKIDG